MAIKVKTKKDIIDQFSFFDEKTGLYRLQIRLEVSIFKETIDKISIEELVDVFNALLQNMKTMAKNEIKEKRVYFK